MWASGHRWGFGAQERRSGGGRMGRGSIVDLQMGRGEQRDHGR